MRCIIKTSLFFSLAISLLLLCSCGGGTTGSGDAPVSIKGLIIESQKAMANAQITNLNTGDSSRSNTNGEFILQTTHNNMPIELLVESAGLEKTVALPAIAKNIASVEITIKVDLVEGNVELATINIIENSDGNPANLPEDPKPTPSKTRSPSPTPKPKPAPEPETLNLFGSVISKNGRALNRVQVQIVGSNSKSSTDKNGSFNISLPNKREVLTISVSYQGSEGSVKISNIPQGRSVDAKLTIQLVIVAPQGDNPNQPGKTKIEVSLTKVSIRKR